ncbi:FxsA family membrane protein [Streptomyces niger]|uniref:FxsA family membrane protein n=1 Tax=Streptomyces niger TaxID=66373 RepID=UPI000AE364E8|nr:FxsA family membrane protein [Streptomyces niger]
MTSATTPPHSRPPQRSRARRLVPLGIAAWAVLEIWLLILVGEAAGGLAVFLLLVAGVVLGGYVIKRAGRRAWKNLTGAFQQPGADPERPAAERSGSNVLPMLGGLLLMCPGLLSDVLPHRSRRPSPCPPACGVQRIRRRPRYRRAPAARCAASGASGAVDGPACRLHAEPSAPTTTGR